MTERPSRQGISRRGFVTGALSAGAGAAVGAGATYALTESGQQAATMLAPNFLKMRARCWGYPRAVWLVHPELFGQVVTTTAPVGRRTTGPEDETATEDESAKRHPGLAASATTITLTCGPG